jgi:hypothetical protein
MRNITLTAFFWFLFAAPLPNASWGQSHQGNTLDGVESPNSPRSQPAKITLGEVEDVILAPLGISLPARIDTGAEISSLDARDVAVRNNRAEFKLGNRYGGSQFQLPFVGWRYVRTSMGTEKRPVVEVSICLGPKLFRTHATLRDRSAMGYPFLVGRSALNGSFLVDPSRSRAAQPNCPVGSLASNHPAQSVKD